MPLMTFVNVAVVTAILALSSPAFAANSDDPVAKIPVDQQAAALVPESFKTKGVITVASDASYAPFEYFDTDNKTMIGYDVDVSDALAATIGLKAEHVNVTFSSILTGLTAGRYDLAMSAFGITPEREKVVDFVGPYFTGGTGLAVKEGNPEKLRMDPKALCGHRISGQAGSFQVDEYLPEMSKDCVAAGKKPIDIKIYRSQNEANLALVSGRVDGVLADSAPLAYQGTLSKGRFELAPGPDYKATPFGIAMPKNSALKPAIDSALKIIKANGTLKKIQSKWGLAGAGD